MSILALTSNTLIGTPATGNIEYNGQFFGTDSNLSRAQLQRLVLSTAVASTSGTSIDFTGIPAWVERITVMFNGVSTSGTSVFLIQLGISTGVETSGYTAMAISSTGGSQSTSSAGFSLTYSNNASMTYQGATTISGMGSNIFVSTGTLVRGGTFDITYSGGSKTLGGTLDRVRITTVNGTDTFDAGSINILYEG